MLGFLRLGNGSVWPGLILHALYNGLMQAAPGLGFERASQLPVAWLLGSAAALAIGSAVIGWMVWTRDPGREARGAESTGSSLEQTGS